MNRTPIIIIGLLLGAAALLAWLTWLDEPPANTLKGGGSSTADAAASLQSVPPEIRRSDASRTQADDGNDAAPLRNQLSTAYLILHDLGIQGNAFPSLSRFDAANEGWSCETLRDAVLASTITAENLLEASQSPNALPEERATLLLALSWADGWKTEMAEAIASDLDIAALRGEVFNSTKGIVDVSKILLLRNRGETMLLERALDSIGDDLRGVLAGDDQLSLAAHLALTGIDEPSALLREKAREALNGPEAFWHATAWSAIAAAEPSAVVKDALGGAGHARHGIIGAAEHFDNEDVYELFPLLSPTEGNIYSGHLAAAGTEAALACADSAAIDALAAQLDEGNQMARTWALRGLEGAQRCRSVGFLLSLAQKGDSGSDNILRRASVDIGERVLDRLRRGVMSTSEELATLRSVAENIASLPADSQARALAIRLLRSSSSREMRDLAEQFAGQ